MISQISFASCVLVVLCCSAVFAFPPVNPDYQWARSEAVEAWHDMKFGLRIHWGMYAIDGLGPESWPLTQNRSLSWMNDYWNQYHSWNPNSYDPAEWIALMRSSGVRFFDFTTKHHEGFSMYDTNTVLHDCWDLTSDPMVPGIVPCPDNHTFSSVQAFGRDIVGELVGAAHAGGIKVGLYFSHIDWYDPNMRIDDWNPLGTQRCPHQPCDPANYNSSSDATSWKRLVYRHRAQIVEVLTKYGEICELSLDMEFQSKFDADMVDTIMLARQIAPNTLIRGRGIGGDREDGGYGDYNTPEEEFPDSPIPGNWQVIFHGSSYMSYDPNPDNYVNGSFIIWHLVDIVAKGGLMQIGYGPDRNGKFHPKAVEALEEVGFWLHTNGQAIYNTRSLQHSWNDTASPSVRYTRSKDNSTIYAIALGFSDTTPLLLPLACVQLPPKASVFLLGYEDAHTREPIPVDWEAQKDTVMIHVPKDAAEMLPGPGFAFVLNGATERDCSHARSRRA